MALVGGASLMLSPVMIIALCRVRALAEDSHCKTFDASGDGYGRSEGVGMILLKRLSLAKQDGDNILGIIKGSAINQDGPSSGLTVPNGNAQQRLLQDALKDAKLSANDISYLEAHGTGTSLGDPIEMHSVAEVLGHERQQDNPLYLGAVKRNIGHTEAAAGVASIIKTVLCLQHKKFPALPVNTVNPRLHLDKIPAIIPDRLSDWKVKGQQRYAGISSFGFSGTNAHMILTEAKTAEKKGNDIERQAHILTLSAQTEAVLKQSLMDYIDYLDTTNESASDIAYSANIGRAHFPYRIEIIDNNSISVTH